jgi:hypothetical protein
MTSTPFPGSAHDTRSWLAPAATAQLGLLLAWASASAPPVRHASLLIGLLATVALVAAARMGTAHCMESRVAAVAVAALTASGVLLTSTVGLPGAAARPLDLPAAALLVVAVAVVALVASTERAPDDDAYAS